MKKLKFAQYFIAIHRTLNKHKVRLAVLFTLPLIGFGIKTALFDIFATTTSTYSIETDTDFAQGSFTSSTVAGSGEGAVLQLSGNAGPDYTQFKRPIQITNNSGSQQADYQISITLDSAALITAGKLQASCPDIRFRDSDDLTEITNYWVENCDADGDEATKIWVKIPEIPAEGKTIYLYYGSNSAASVSSVSNTFIREITDVRMALPFEEPTGSQVLDTSGNNNNGTLSNHSRIVAKFNNGYRALTSSLLTVPDSDSLSMTDFSMSFWFKWNAGTQGWSQMGKFLSSSPDANNEYKMQFLQPDGRWYMRYNNSTHLYQQGSGLALLNTIDTWHHFVVTYNSADGKWILKQNYSRDLLNANRFVSMTPTAFNFYLTYFNADIDDVRVYAKALTDQEISDLYNNFGYTTPNYVGKELVRKFAYLSGNTSGSEGITTSSPGDEEIALVSNGTWQSALNENIIDLKWNGGWGDGTASSVGFSATQTDTSADNTVTYSIRTGSTLSELANNSFIELGTATSNAVFSKTKSELDALNVSAGLDRYIQIKVTMDQTTQINPKVDTISLFYLSDNSPPDQNASDIQLYETLGGTEVLALGWLNSTSPFFDWIDASDDQSQIKGYCLYIGTDSAGNPVSSKGLLGTSPVSTSGTGCQFIAQNSQIDLSTSIYKGSPWLTSGTGNYYLNIKAIDHSNNIFGESESFEFTYDDIAPTNPTGLSAPQGYQRDVTAFTISWLVSGPNGASDEHSTVKGYQYKIGNSGTWYGSLHTGNEDCSDLIATSFYTLDPVFDALEPGDNTFYLRTWDNACNVSETTVSAVLKYNADSPSAPTDLSVTPITNTINVFSFDWDLPESYQGEGSNLSYCYTINTLPSLSRCSYTNNTSLDADAYATQPGDNSFYLVARDEAGNVNYADYAQITFNANTPAPGFPQNVDVADISVKNTQNWKLAISWELPENTGAGVETYQVYRAESINSCSSSFSSFELIGTTAGTTYADGELIQQDYSYCIKACDSANNCSAVSETRFGFPDGKFTEPASLTSGPVTTNITTRKATIYWTTERTSDSKVAFGLATGEYFEEEPSSSTHTSDHSITLNNLSPGTLYYYVAKWTDEDGNTGISSEKTFTTEPPPLIKEVATKSVSLSSATIQFTSRYASRANIFYGISNNFGGSIMTEISSAESTYLVSIEGLNDGTKYYYQLNLIDEEGETYPSDLYSFETLPRPKISNVTLQQVYGTAQPTVLVQWNSNTDITSIITYSIINSPGTDIVKVDLTPISGEHAMVIENLLPTTQYQLIVSGSDKQGNTANSDTQIFTTSSDTRPPKISKLQVEPTLNSLSTKVADTIEAQLIVSWETDEQATSQIEYGEGTGSTYSKQTLQEMTLSTQHIMVISGLNPSTVYHLRAISADSAGNIGKSVDNVTITPKATDNALDLVINSLRQIFKFLE